jgi:hypothetical protein
MEIKYPGLASFLFALIPLPVFYLVRFGFSFMLITKGETNWWKYTHQSYWSIATLWAFAFPLLGVTRFFYWWMAQDAFSPNWDKALGMLSLPMLVLALIIYSTAVGLSLSGRGL